MRKNANSFPDKNLRGDPRLLGAVQRRTPTTAGDCETHHVPGSTIVTPRRRRAAKGSDLPYKVALIKGGTAEAPTYEVTVGWGYVCERKPGPDDAIIYHEAANMYEEVDPPTDPVTFTDKLRRFPITVGQAVYIRAEVDENGFIVPPEPEGEEPPVDAVLIEIGADEEDSVHYQPKVDDESSDGVAGYSYYKLAVLKAGEGEGALPKLEKWLTGSHIAHYQELPAMLTALAGGEGIGVVPKEWSESEKAYKLRAIRQKDPVEAVPPAGEDPGSPAQAVQLHVTQEANAIRIEGNSKIRSMKYQVADDTPIEFAAIDDGLETLGTPEGNEVIIPIPEVIGRAADPQVTVTPIATGYRVEGNGVNGSYGITINGGSAEELFEAKDGLVASAGKNVNIEIPDELPNPGSPGTGNRWVLHHDGTDPSWVLYEEITVHICVAGTPTEYKILGVPVV